MPQYFNGRFLVQPQTAVMVDDSKLANLNPSAANMVAYVGKSTAGLPQVPVLLTGPAVAKRVLRSGDLLDAAMLAFDPSSDTGGATQMYVVRVNNAIQSKARIFDIANPVKASGTVTIAGTPAAGNTITITVAGTAVAYVLQTADAVSATTAAAAMVSALNSNATVSGLVTATNTLGVVTLTSVLPGVDGNAITLTASCPSGATATASGTTLASGTGNTIANLVSNDYGLYCNSIYYYVATGSTSGYKATIGVTSTDVQGGSLVQDNIARPLLQIQYTGAGSAATLTVNDTQLSTTITGAAGDAITVPFATFTTIQAVADFINNQGGKYTCTVQGSAGTFSSAAQFDPVSALNIKATAQTLNGHIAALVDFLNSAANPFCTATRGTSIPAGATAYVNTNAIFFMGGSDGTTTASDWTNAINSLQNVDCYIVCPITEDASVHAAVSTHVQYMTDAGRKPRVGICGGALNEYSSTAAVPTATVSARAVALGSKRMTLVSPGVWIYDSKGNKVLKSAAFTAAMYAGMAAAVPQGTPLTHKWLSNIQGLETVYSIADRDALVSSGVTVIENVSGRGYRVVSSKTTWNGAPNFGKNEFSTLAAIDAVVRRVQDTLDEQLIGQVVSPVTLAQAMSITETVLMQCAVDGFIVGDDKNKPYRKIQATANGDTIQVAFEISPVIPANFILVTATTVPWTGSAS